MGEDPRRIDRMSRGVSVLRIIGLTALAGGMLAAPTAAAQETGVLAGHVLAFGTNVPIAGAQVKILASDAMSVTDRDGYFVFRDVTEGSHTVIVHALGYQPALSRGQSVLPAVLTTVDFVLRSTAFELEEIEVIGEPGSEIKASSAVTVLTAHELPPEGDLLLGLQGRVPGLNVSYPARRSKSPVRTDGLVVTGRNGMPMMWVLDGVPFPGTMNFYVDAGDVDCVEVRRGARSVMEFLRAGAQSSAFGGVILIWTKRGVRRRVGACVGQESNP